MTGVFLSLRTSLPEKSIYPSARKTRGPSGFGLVPHLVTYRSPLHRGASLGYWRGVGRRQPVPVRGGENGGSRGGTFSAARFSALESVGPGAGETAGEHQADPVQHGASPGRPLRRALFSGGLHNIPVKYNCF